MSPFRDGSRLVDPPPYPPPPPLTPPTHSVPGEVRVRGERGEWVIPLPSRNIRGIFIPKLLYIYPPRNRILRHNMKCIK